MRTHTSLLIRTHQHRIWIVFWTLATILLAYEIANGENNEFVEPKYVKYKALFLTTDAGTVAFLPRIGNAQYATRAREFGLLPLSGSFKLPVRGNYVFWINTVTGNTESRFVQVVIYTIFPGGVNQRLPIYLYRKGKWSGGSYDDGKPRTIKNPVKFHLDDSIESLREKHKLSLKDVDDFMKENWHAWLRSSDENSWELRKALETKPPAHFAHLLQECGLAQDAAEICLTVQLLTFDTLDGPRDTDNPLDFELAGDNALGAYIHIDSPGDETFTRDFYLRFDPTLQR